MLRITSVVSISSHQAKSPEMGTRWLRTNTKRELLTKETAKPPIACLLSRSEASRARRKGFRVLLRNYGLMKVYTVALSGLSTEGGKSCRALSLRGMRCSS